MMRCKHSWRRASSTEVHLSDRRYFPLDVPAWINKTRHLTPVQRDRYLHLLLRMWSDGGPIDADPRAIANALAIRDVRDWLRIAPAVLPFFTVGADGRLRNKRLTTELGKWRRRTNGAGDATEAAEAVVKTVPLPPQNHEQAENKSVDKPVNCLWNAVDNPREIPGISRSDIVENERKSATLQYNIDSESTYCFTETRSEPDRPATDARKRSKDLRRQDAEASRRRQANTARARWEADLAQSLGALFADAIPILNANPGICDRATLAEQRKRGSGASTAAMGIRQQLRREGFRR